MGRSITLFASFCIWFSAYGKIYSKNLFCPLDTCLTHQKSLLYLQQHEEFIEKHIPSKCGWCNIWVFGSWLPKSRCARGACWSWAGFWGTWQWDTLRIRHGHFFLLLIRLIDGDRTGPPGPNLAWLSQFGGSGARRLAADIGVDAAGAGAVPTSAWDPSAAGLRWARQASILQRCLRVHVQNAIVLVLRTV